VQQQAGACEASISSAISLGLPRGSDAVKWPGQCPWLEGGARNLGIRLAAAAVAGALLVLAVLVAGRWAHDTALARLQELGSARLAQYATIFGDEFGRVLHHTMRLSRQPGAARKSAPRGGQAKRAGLPRGAAG
jgi:hypothetical protein